LEHRATRGIYCRRCPSDNHDKYRDNNPDNDHDSHDHEYHHHHFVHHDNLDNLDDDPGDDDISPAPK